MTHQPITYTFIHNQKINQKIQKDLDLICNCLASLTTKLDNIILVGSFARGEGSFIEYQGKYSIINDYDLVLVCQDPIILFKLSKIRRTLQRKLNIPQVDIKSYSKSALSRLPPTVFNYDLKHCGLVIRGNQQILKLVPNYTPNLLPLQEAFKPLFIYLSGFLKTVNLNFITQKTSYNRESLFWVAQQTSKTLIGVVTSILIAEGIYCLKYAQRGKLFNKLVHNKPQFEPFKKYTDICREVFNFKLAANLTYLTNSKIVHWWQSTATMYLTWLEIFTNHYLCKEINYEVQKSPHSLQKAFYLFIRGQSWDEIIKSKARDFASPFLRAIIHLPIEGPTCKYHRFLIEIEILRCYLQGKPLLTKMGYEHLKFFKNYEELTIDSAKEFLLERDPNWAFFQFTDLHLS